MTRTDGSLDWRAVGAIAVFLVALFTVTNFLTNDKIDSKVQIHEIKTESEHQREIASIKREIAQSREEVAVIGTRQESVLSSIEELKAQNVQIIRKLNER